MDISTNKKPKNLELSTDEINTIEYYIETGQRSEESGEMESALKSYEKALVIAGSTKDERVYKLYIKLGDILQLRGDIDKSLEYFESAYNTALLLQDKIFQIDSLGKMVQDYLIKGRVEESIKLAEMADKLLKDINYLEGKLEISLCWIKIYSSQNEYYKAREIGNEAVTLCGNKYLFHKGRILNFLAILYSELISVDEHLNMLKNALRCFEEANSLRGILGITNNIAEVYADKLQDNDKALEYYFKLKEGSESSGYKELEVLSYVNIGEIYFKKMMFDDALFWLKNGLKKAKEASIRNMILYSYSYLIYTSLRTYHYKNAYNYYSQTIEELSVYPEQGTTLALFHKAASRLFLEFGQIEKAKAHIKETLNIVGNVQSIVRWNMELVYELIRLKGARNRTEILDLIQNIKFILSKYKNPESILDIVYDFAIELIDSGYSELAFELIDEYENLKIDQKVLNAKYAYIKVKRNSVNKTDELKNLEYALELSLETKISELHWRLLSSIGDLYLEEGSLNNAVSYYSDACRTIDEILLEIPTEFKEDFKKIHHMQEPFQKLNEIK